MAKYTKVTHGTGAITDGNQVAFTIPAVAFRVAKPFLIIEGLAGAETVNLWVADGNGGWEEVTDSSGTAIQFTVDYAADVLNAPGEYGITKSVTAGTITVKYEDAR